MLGFRRVGLVSAIATAVAAACSLVNAPDDVIPGAGGSGGQGTSSRSSSASTTASTSTTSTSTTSSTATSSSTSASSSSSSTTTTTSGTTTTTTTTTEVDAGGCHSDADCASLATECIGATCGDGGVCDTQNKLDGTGCGMSFCSNGLCKAGHCNITPINEGVACNDGLFCTINDACKSGFCVGAPNPCPTGAQCVEGVCDEASKSCVMMPIPDNSPCNDGNPCHADAFCSSQMCIGGLAPTVLFQETFAGNAQGWTLGPEWGIGHATHSFGQSFGNPDPSVDHTGEGGVAGVVIGGNAFVASPDPTHPPYYLTSPPVNTMVAGTLYLTFYRWLNSDYTPYMQNTVEATADGSTWTVIWETAGAPPITDSQWTFQALDITVFKSQTTQVRFGFSIGDPGVFTVSSWNLDDVKVQNAPCPM